MSTPKDVSDGAGPLLRRTPSQANGSTRTATSRPFRAVPVIHLATPRRSPSESRPLPKVLAVPNILAVRCGRVLG